MEIFPFQVKYLYVSATSYVPSEAKDYASRGTGCCIKRSPSTTGPSRTRTQDPLGGSAALSQGTHRAKPKMLIITAIKL